MRTVHLYPFPVVGLHGGTLRLRMALHAADEPELYCFRSDGEWSDAHATLSEARDRDAGYPAQHGRSALERAKRAISPATLYESGRRAERGASPLLRRLALARDDVVVLHTSYLAGLADDVRRLGARSLTDVYDLVWRAHLLEARHGSGALMPPRAAYAATVRAREVRRIARADVVAVAGWADSLLLGSTVAASRWVPTGIDVERVNGRTRSAGPLRVGMLGNFAHHATKASARVLLASRLMHDPRVRLVFAGYGAREHLTDVDGKFTVLGEVGRPEEFYAGVDVVVVPVSSGAGMKCKLAEALMAGRPVITSPLGASGFRPDLQRWFRVVANLADLTAEQCLSAARAETTEAAARSFRRELSLEAGVSRYASLYREAAGAPAAR